MPDIFRAQVVGGTKIISPIIAHEVDLMNITSVAQCCETGGYSLIEAM